MCCRSEISPHVRGDKLKTGLFNGCYRLGMTPRASALVAPAVSPETASSSVYLCFECDRFQRSPSPCIYCGSPCQELETPPGALKGKTLLEVFTERGLLDDVELERVGGYSYTVCRGCGEPLHPERSCRVGA